MIDVQYFQTLLLIVCILALVMSVFLGTIFNSSNKWIRWGVNLFTLVLGVASGFSALMLLILK